MSGILDSPFIRAFTATNSFVLGAGALYLIAACGETKETAPTNLSPDGTLQHQRKQAHRGLYEFSRSLSEWTDNLTVLKNMLGEQSVCSLDEMDSMDQVDGLEMPVHSNYSPQILVKLEESLGDVMEKVSELRALLKQRQYGGRGRKQDFIIVEDFTGADLLLLRDEDSDADSFLSAASDIENEDDVSLTKTDKAKQKALEIADSHRNKSLYLASLELHFRSGIKCRKKRTRMVGCSTDAEYIAKVHCIREASKLAFANEEIQERLEKNTEDLLGYLIKTAGKDVHECQRRWKALVSFCRLPENWEVMERELRQRGVPYVTFYDVVLDFIIMDAFDDLENPPYSVKAAVQNGWLPTYIQQTGLETAVWGVLKAKMQMLQEPAGFLMHFYHLSEILTPVLAWGFLGSDDELKKACNTFKEQTMGYIQDLFDFHCSDYISVESLSKDISRLAEERYENLVPLLSKM